jgi:hypothetical protein
MLVQGRKVGTTWYMISGREGKERKGKERKGKETCSPVAFIHVYHTA